MNQSFHSDGQIIGNDEACPDAETDAITTQTGTRKRVRFKPSPKQELTNAIGECVPMEEDWED